jgi:hypothetical protein
MRISHAVRRDGFRTVVVSETGPLSLLANDVVEYQNKRGPREGGPHRVVARSGEAERLTLLGPGEW